MVDSLKERLLPKSMSESIYSANPTTRSALGALPSWRRQSDKTPQYVPVLEAQTAKASKELNNSVNELDQLVKTRGKVQAVDLEPMRDSR